MLLKKPLLFSLLFSAMLGLSSATAKADLVFLGPAGALGPVSGSLNIQHDGFEQGTAGICGAGRFCTTGNTTNPEPPGIPNPAIPQSHLGNLMALGGFTDGGLLQLLLTINQTDANPYLTVQSLTVNIYDTRSDSVAFTATFNGSLTLTTGAYVFGLDSTSAGQLTALLSARPDYGNLFAIGFGLSAGCGANPVASCQSSNGAAETVRATAAVPEPTTMLLLGTGLAGVFARLRGRKQTGEIT